MDKTWKRRHRYYFRLGSESEVFKTFNGSWSMITRTTSILKDSNVAKYLSRIHNNYVAFSDRQNP
jgi:hypothetical protein